MKESPLSLATLTMPVGRTLVGAEGSFSCCSQMAWLLRGPPGCRARGKMFVSLSLCTSNEGCSFQGLLGGLNLRGSFRRWSLLIPGLGDIFLWRLAAQEPDSRQHFPLIMRASA